MQVTEKLRQRFCKNYNLPIKVYQEPYFSERLDLFQAEFGARDKWEEYTVELCLFRDEYEYF